MKHIYKTILIIFIAVVQISGQSQENLYYKALQYYQSGKYQKALEIIGQIDSNEIDVSQLRAQVLDKLNSGKIEKDILNKTPKTVINKKESDEELYNKALRYYKSKYYTDALLVLSNIDSTKLNYTPLKNQILVKIQEEKNAYKPEPVISVPVKKPVVKVSIDTAAQEQIASTLNDTNNTSIGNIPDSVFAAMNEELSDSNQAASINTLAESDSGETAAFTGSDSLPAAGENLASSENVTQNQKNQSSENKDTGEPFFLYLILLIIVFGAVISAMVIYGANVFGSSKDDVEGIPGISLLLENNGKIYNFRQDIITIGKKRKNSIVLSDKNVSKHHAEIFYNSVTKSFYIRDLDSYTGTFVNRKKITATKIKPGDTIQISYYSLSFEEREKKPIGLVYISKKEYLN